VPVKQDLPGAGGNELGQQVEAGGLASAVRPDQGMNVATLNAQIDLTHGDKALELPGQAAGLENDV